MRIDKIRIQNFKGFEDETFELNPRFTVFIGENGAGKTSVLDALAVGLHSYFYGIDGAEMGIRESRPSEIRVAMVDNEPRPQLPMRITEYGELNGVKIDGGWHREITKISGGNGLLGGMNITSITRIAEKMVIESRSKGGVTFPVIAYHGTGRLTFRFDPIEYSKQIEGIQMAYTKCLSAASSNEYFLSWYKTYEDEVRKFDQEEDKIALRIFNECITSMIPDGRWQDMAFSFKEDDLIGTFTTDLGNKEKLLFSQLSDGYRNVIGMVADIAYRCIKLNPHLGENAIKETPGIVLIDELDLHLHPNWQRRIVKDLKNAFPKVQFVATTHSPFIVQSLESDELVNLDKLTDVDPQDLKIDDIATNVMGVESSFSAENQEMSLTMKSLMAKIDSGDAKEEIVDAIENITDPGVRAFLELYQMAKKA